MTTIAEIDVVINAKLDPLIKSGKQAEKIIRDLDKRLNALASKTYAPKVGVKVNSTKDLAAIERRLKQLNKTYTAAVATKVNSTKDLAAIERRLKNLKKNQTVNITTKVNEKAGGGLKKELNSINNI